MVVPPQITVIVPVPLPVLPLMSQFQETVPPEPTVLGSRPWAVLERPDGTVYSIEQVTPGGAWTVALARFSALEPHPVEVGLGGSSGPPTPVAPPLAGGSPAGAWARQPPRQVNALWWLAPILAGWLGGLVAWLVNREVDPRIARYMLVTGIAISVAGVLLFLTVLRGSGVRPF